MEANIATMRIGQMADALGVATSTIRYYEREKILQPAMRSQAGYRLYDPSALEQLRFIRTAQSVGFTLQDIKALLTLDKRTSCKQVQSMITERLADIKRRIDELHSIQKTLNTALKRCQKSRRGCPVLADLPDGRRVNR